MSASCQGENAHMKWLGMLVILQRSVIDCGLTSKATQDVHNEIPLFLAIKVYLLGCT